MDDDPKRLSTRIQLLATLVATATYAAGFNPPGGVWQDIHDPAGHLPGDPIMLSTHYRRYAVFFYCNAVAFTLSLVVVVVTLFVTAYPKDSQHPQRKKEINWCLGLSMAAAMVAFTVAYGAGACRTKLTIVWYSIQVPLPLLFVMYQAFSRQQPGVAGPGGSSSIETDKSPIRREEGEGETRKEEEEEEYFQAFHSLMVPLSMFALTITYVAGLSTPGGFWDSAEGGHRPGDAILGDRLQGRTLRGFLTFNTTAFVASLYALSLLTVHLKKPYSVSVVSVSILSVHLRKVVRLGALFYLLLGLLFAYIIGNSRGRVNWPLYGEVFACMVAYVVVHVLVMKTAAYYKVSKLAGEAWSRLADTVSRLAGTVSRRLSQMCRCAAASEDEEATNDVPIPTTDTEQQQKDRRRCRRAYLVQLMAGLAVAITYQAGLYPPGGLWAANADGHTAGDPILLTTNARRYKGFYYCNSVSFVASLLAIFLAQKKFLHEHHALEAAMLLDMLGLVGSYAIGSCRDQVSTLYVAGLAGAGVVYVFVHVSYFTLGEKDRAAGAGAGGDNNLLQDQEDGVENMGGRFLLFAVLVASITYQAGLTPPGGFLLKDDAQSGHHAGDPVLLYNYPRRYRAFFYCNSVSFMLSIVLILLLVNPNEYRPAIRSHALSVCSAVSYVCLMGAFAAGSTQHLEGSYVIFVLAGLPSLSSVILFCKYCNRRMMKGDGPSGSDPSSTRRSSKYSEKSEYLMTLAILVASATYPAGLDPPGGSWQSSSDGHDAGNPVMHDNRRPRYLAFFVGNTASFLASLMLILVLLFAMLRPRHKETCGSLSRKRLPPSLRRAAHLDAPPSSRSLPHSSPFLPHSSPSLTPEQQRRHGLWSSGPLQLRRLSNATVVRARPSYSDDPPGSGGRARPLQRAPSGLAAWIWRTGGGSGGRVAYPASGW